MPGRRQSALWPRTLGLPRWVSRGNHPGMPDRLSAPLLHSPAAPAQRAASREDPSFRGHRPASGPSLRATSGPGLLLESGLLGALYTRARLGHCTAVDLTLSADGAVELLLSGVSLTPRELERLAAGMGEVEGSAAAWERLLSGAPGVELDLFEPRETEDTGTQWHLAVVDGVWLGRLARVLRPEPTPGRGGGVLRLRLLPSPALAGLDLRGDDERDLLIERLTDLAMLVPGLRVSLTEPSEGLLRATELPRGPAQRLSELTEGSLTLLEAPLALEARWQGLRARCAVQWCVEGPTRLWGFEDGCRSGASDAPIAVLLSALRAGLALHAHGGLEVVPLGRLMRGLTAIVTLDRIRTPQRCETVRGSLTATEDLSDPDFLSEAVRELTPLLVAALAVNPRADRLLRWVVEVPIDEGGEALPDAHTSGV